MPTYMWWVIAAWFIREIYFHFLTHRLLNKLMSRDYAEYAWIKSSGKMNQTPKVKVDPGFENAEDLSILNGVGIG